VRPLVRAYDLVLYRILQASGAAMVFSISAAIMFEVSREETGKSDGIRRCNGCSGRYRCTNSGGFITDSLGWEIFLINVQFGVVVRVLQQGIPVSRKKTGTSGWMAGIVSMVISIVSLVLLLERASPEDQALLVSPDLPPVFFLSVTSLLVVERKAGTHLDLPSSGF